MRLKFEAIYPKNPCHIKIPKRSSFFLFFLPHLFCIFPLTRWRIFLTACQEVTLKNWPCSRARLWSSFSMVEYSLDLQNINLTAIRTVRVLRPLKAINRVPSESQGSRRCKSLAAAPRGQPPGRPLSVAPHPLLPSSLLECRMQNGFFSIARRPSVWTRMTWCRELFRASFVPRCG